MKQQYKAVITTILLSLSLAACGDKQESQAMASSEKQDTAVEHAQRARKFQLDANPTSKIYEINPYTNVDELLESINKLKVI